MLLLLLAGVGLWPSMLLLLTRHFAAGQRAQASSPGESGHRFRCFRAGVSRVPLSTRRKP